MNKTINIFFMIILSISLFSAQYNPISQEKLNEYLKELQEKGTLNTDLIKNIEKLHYSQKEQIISSIKFDSDKFWTQWKEEFNEQQKRGLLKELSLEQRNSFMEKYGKHYDINFINLGDENIFFGKENTIGNNGGYFQIDMIETYNKKNPENKIVSVEYKEKPTSIKIGEVKTKNSLIFKREKGNSLEISTEGETTNGFYFNPDSGYLGKVGKDGIVDKNNPLTGHWNSKGSLKISTNEEGGTTINFDFNRNSKGKAEDPVDYSKFTNLKGESYSVFQDPTGKDNKGNTIYKLKPGELNFDTDGKLTKINNMYKNPEINKDTKSWGGFFGKDTSIVYTEEEFKSAKGSKVMVDLEKGQIKSEVARVEEGIVPDVKNIISKLQEGIKKFRKKIDKSIPKIEKAYEVLSKARKDYNDKEKGFIGEITGITKEGVKLAAVQSRVRESIAKDIGLTPENSLVKFISTSSGLEVTRNVLRYASKGLGAAGDISNYFIKGIGYLDNPIFKSLNPAPESRINIQLNSPTSTKLKNIEMYDGSLEIADSYGNLVPVVKRATSYGYVLPSTLNKQTNYFDGINFDLHNSNYKDGQNIKIFSNNGKLNAIGIGGLQDLKTVNGKYVIDAGGGVSYRYKFLFWGDEGYKGEYANVLTANYKTNLNAKEKAIAFQREANNQYKILYDKYKTKGWTRSEITELTKKYEDNFVEYNRILNSQDVELSISSNRLNQILNSFSKTERSENNPTIEKIRFDTFYNDKILQRQLVERGIITRLDIESFVNKELANIDNFVRSNPSTYLQFVKDSSNGIYQIKTGGATYNIDPVAGPFISSTLPVILNHGGIDSNGKFYLDMTNSRFGNTIGINVYGGHYEGVWASMRAKRNANAIEFGIANTVQEIVKQKLMDPKSKGYKIYSPSY